jgi:FkbM family methyltransferase
VPRLALPDGLPVWAPNRLEAAVLYHELFELRTYERHGVRVRDGDCVFDVGAHAGLYLVYLARRHARLRLFAFEPVPALYALLERNAALHGGSCAVRLFPVGLGAAPGAAAFEVPPGLGLGASMRPGDVRAAARRGAPRALWARAAVEDLRRVGRLPPGLAGWLLAGLERRALRPATSLVVLAAAAAAAGPGILGRPQRVRRPLRTVSQVIEAQGVGRIDLLKVDAEGAESEVLAGIAPAHWPRIRQVVAEVHDVDDRVAALAARLRGLGFRTAIDQEDWSLHRLLSIYTLYAVRDG